MKENEIWRIVKDHTVEEKVNRYDAYVFILDHISKLEKLMGREITSEEIPRIIDQALIYLNNT